MQRRDDRVLEFWDRSKELSTKNKEYRNFVSELLSLLLKNDMQIRDLTTSLLIKNDKNISAYIVAKEDGILAGMEEFSFLNKDLKLKFFKKDGDMVNKGNFLVEINGSAKKILERERISLNLLQRMSGIATLTNKLSKELNNRIRIAATRKTLWGLLDKKAVSIVGGLTHRLNLNDRVVIKDNHLKILNYNIENVLNTIKNKSNYIEIEVENKNQALTTAKNIKRIIEKNNNKSTFAIMLDKISPIKIKSIIKDLKNRNLYNYVLLEASGNINPNNLTKYKDCDIDVVSIGYLTNSPRILNMSLEIK